MAAPPPPIPFVATQDMLAEWFHKEFAPTDVGCYHNDSGRIKQCEEWAARLLASGVVQDGGEFIGTLGENPTIQGVIKGHLAEAWHDGWFARDQPWSPTKGTNPYAAEEEPA